MKIKISLFATLILMTVTLVWQTNAGEEPPDLYLPFIIKPDDSCLFRELTDENNNLLGIIKVDAEAVVPDGDWVLETAVDGWRGNGYLRWAGPNHWAAPGGDVTSYEFELQTSGDYLFYMRNHHDNPDASLENDMWIRLDGGEWRKAFSWRADRWSWITQHDSDGINIEMRFNNLTEGRHTLDIAGRSTNFRLDQWTLYAADSGLNGIDSEYVAQTECS